MDTERSGAGTGGPRPWLRREAHGASSGRSTPRAFFDLDGTLTEPAPGITRSIRYALAALGRHAPADDELTWCIGPPLAESFALLLDHDVDLVARAVALYRERFSSVGMYENAVHPGIDRALARLAGAGIRLFVATSKPHAYARRIVEHFGLRDHFGAVFGAELDGTRAHKAQVLAHALDETGGRGGPAVMVGDRHHDIRGAAANGLPAIGVLWGYGDRAELAAAGADRVIAATHELAGAVCALTAGCDGR